MTGEEFDIIYDMFPYQNTIIVAGRLKGASSTITLCQGRLDLTKNIIDLNPNFYKATGVVSGAVLVDQSTMTYHELDISAKTLGYYQLKGDFTSPTWNTKILNQMSNVQMPALDEDHIWIKGFHASQWGGVIYYGQPSRYDPGATVLDWVTQRSMYDNKNLVTVYDRDYIAAGMFQNSHALMLFRDEPMFLVEGGYYSGKNKITLTATDDDGTATVTANLTVLDHIWDKLSIKNTIGSIEILSSTSQLFAFKEEDIIDGNGLNVVVKTNNENALKGTGYTQAPVRVTWKGGDLVGKYTFAHNKVVLVDASNTANLGTCVDLSNNPITIQCTKVATTSVGSGYKFNTKIIAHQGITVGWSNNIGKGSSNVHILTEDGDANTVNFKKNISDIGFMTTNTYFFVFIVYDKDSVEIRRLNKNDIQEFETYLVLNQSNVLSDFFCPHGVSIPDRSQDEYDILSDCGRGLGKYVLRMGLSRNTNFFQIPLSLRYNTIGFCSFRHEFVINAYEGVFSITNEDSFNFWDVPLEDLDAGFEYEMFCIPALGKVAYVGHGKKGNQNTLVSQNEVSSSINQGRRFPGFVVGVEAQEVRAYEFLGRLFWVIENEGKTTFLTTFDTPRIKWNAGATLDEIDVQVEITVYNKGSQQKFLQLATVYPHD